MNKLGSFQDLIEELDDTVDADMYLEFAEDGLPFGDAELAATNALGEYDLAEILEMNEIDDTEVLALLYHNGEIGLPALVEDEEDESVPDTDEDEEV